jgi:hypothetical protein
VVQIYKTVSTIANSSAVDIIFITALLSAKIFKGSGEVAFGFEVSEVLTYSVYRKLLYAQNSVSLSEKKING